LPEGLNPIHGKRKKKKKGKESSPPETPPRGGACLACDRKLGRPGKGGEKKERWLRNYGDLVGVEKEKGGHPPDIGRTKKKKNEISPSPRLIEKGEG